MKTKINKKQATLDSYSKKRIDYANNLFQIALEKELEIDLDFGGTIDTTIEIEELISVKGNKVTIKYIDFGYPVKETYNASKYLEREDMLRNISMITIAIKKAQLN